MPSHDPLDFAKTMEPGSAPGGSHAAALPEGAMLGQYRIVRLLGRGGMGDVYEVEHTVLCRRYALKLLPADFATRPGALERFKREARAMANLDHPNIVKVDEFGETPSTGSGQAVRYWLRMELAEGGGVDGCEIRSLAEYAEAKGGRLDPDEAAFIFRQILEGLAHAHSHGVVHRDLKPANILLFGLEHGARSAEQDTDSGSSSKLQAPGSGLRCKISDFGLVRMVGEEWLLSQADQSIRLSMSLGGMATQPPSGAGTSTRSLIGTYEYMSPEQKRGEDATAASDVYAVGLMMYRLLTGLPELSRKSVSQLVSGAPAAWDELVDTAVEPDASVRFADAAAMLAAWRLSRKAAPPAAPPAAVERPAGTVKRQPAVVKTQPAPRKPETPAEVRPEAPAVVPSLPDYPPSWAAESPGSKQPAVPAKQAAGKAPPPRRNWTGWIVAAVVLSALLTALWVSDMHTKRQQREETRQREAELARQREEARLAEERRQREEARLAEETRQREEAEKRNQAVEPRPSGGAMQVPPGFRAVGTVTEPYTKTGWAKEIVHEATGIEMVYIPAGSFTMGSPLSESDRGDDETQHRVTLTKGFYLGKYEVTQDQWQKVMGGNPSYFKNAGGSAPVEQVSWEDCQEFCGKMGTGFRLPTEAQWEYACRAGTTTAFHYGNSLDATMANFDGNYPYGGGAKGQYRQTTVAVGQFRPNAWGLYDMHGNVWEWCQDWYGEYPTGAVTDPSGPRSGSHRVGRGGCWILNARYCRSAGRGRYDPGYRYINLGFRLLMAVP